MEQACVKIVFYTAIALIIMFGVTACSSVGTGRSTIILAPKPNTPKYHGNQFSGLIASSVQGVELRSTGDGKPFTVQDWNSTVAQRFGASAGPHPEIGTVSITVRDRTRTPPFAAQNFDLDRQDEVVKILLNPDLDSKKKVELIDRARNNYVTLPEAGSRVVFDRRYPADDKERAGYPQWRYFVELEVNLTGTLESADPSESFSYLGAALRIPDGVKARFVNFSPKQADLFDIAIGNLTNNAKLTGSLSRGLSAGSEDTLVDTTKDKVSDTDKQTSGATASASTGFELSETLAREIKLGLDTRATGIHDDGRVFLMELRGTDRKRIAGTYSYLVMLEVESEANPIAGIEDYIIAQPLEKSIDLETRAVGVIRHVVQRGRTGTFSRVPEPLNDHTFNQVILNDGYIEQVWRFSEIPRGEFVPKEVESPNVLIRTAMPKASFFISDSTGKVLKFGSGTQETFRFPPGEKLKVTFLPIVETGAAVIEFVAPEKAITIPDSGAVIVVGEYAAKSIHIVPK